MGNRDPYSDCVSITRELFFARATEFELDPKWPRLGTSAQRE